jgi:hypothetical protein
LLTKGPCGLTALVWSVLVSTQVAAAQGPGAADARQGDRIAQSQQLEGEAILALADAAMAGKPVPADFRVEWQNDFLKAQRGTFVPFTLTVDLSRISRPAALVYVRAVRQDAAAAPDAAGDRRRDQKNAEPDYPVDAIFPVELRQEPGQVARIHRGFSLAPGQYDVIVVLRERMEPAVSAPQPRASVLRQALTVPDYWIAELTTSTVIVADRLDVLREPPAVEDLAERPYVIGQNDVTPAADRRFRRDEELIVIFLVYNPTVTREKKYDLQVEYHFFRRAAGPVVRDAREVRSDHPPELESERYFNHTEPQRFNTATAGALADPAAAQPVVAGQGVPLAGFEPGEYRLAIRIMDLLSGKSIVRDVLFTVAP